MEVRLAVGRALRYQSSSSIPCVARTARTRIAPRSTSSLFARRPFSSSSSRWQDSNTDANKHLNAALDLKTGTPGSSRQGSSHFASPRAQQERQAERSRPSRLGLPSSRRQDSMDDLLNDFASLGASSSQSRSSQGTGTLSSIRPERKGDHLAMGSLLDPASSSISSKLDPRGNTNKVLRSQSLPLPLPVRLGPSLGRTVKVNPSRNIDVGRAFRQLEILCRKNQVRNDAARQKFHERPGLKRKRVRSERWRRTFKEGFKGMIALVKKMKKQGW
ncbi:hypothetical protein K461DRAFT_279728 [Myriangium duriaei CBS 260.36]|uniref:Ribosomal protein S21 n=1 Tax=Myriangium duriaei CBS 260.36 TaxID=1168546 RepID=A0A9P4IWJ3_9PEZI|nr:hypothetical protein K461DRAFT_279728 [Myriangium duriaei CBS 260.36]